MSEDGIEQSYDADIITLYAETGQKVEFEKIAGVNLNGNFYLILHPKTPLEGVQADEAWVFRVWRGQDGTDSFAIEHDEDIVDEVFHEYEKTYSEKSDSTDD